MSKRQNADDGGLMRGYKPVACITPIGVVTECTKVQLDGSQSYFEYDNSNNNSNKFLGTAAATRRLKAEDGVAFLWEQVEGTQVALKNQDSATPSFTAPYVDLDRTSKKAFMLVASFSFFPCATLLESIGFQILKNTSTQSIRY